MMRKTYGWDESGRPFFVEWPIPDAPVLKEIPIPTSLTSIPALTKAFSELAESYNSLLVLLRRMEIIP